jgi:predicted RNase H-like HicB family nuclease
MEISKMSKQFNVVIEQDKDGYFVALVPSLPGCHTQAKSLDQLMERIQEAIELYIEVEGVMSPSLSFVGIQQVTIAV